MYVFKELIKICTIKLILVFRKHVEIKAIIVTSQLNFKVYINFYKILIVYILFQKLTQISNICNHNHKYILTAKCEGDCLNLFFEGETNRSIAAHSLNKNSSRSHCIFTVHIEVDCLISY